MRINTTKIEERREISTPQECVDGLECFVEATRSLGDEFGSAINGDITLITGSYLIILAYTIFNLSSTPFLKSRIILSLGAILVSVQQILCRLTGCLAYIAQRLVFVVGASCASDHALTDLRYSDLNFVLVSFGVDASWVVFSSITLDQCDPSQRPSRIRPNPCIAALV